MSNTTSTGYRSTGHCSSGDYSCGNYSSGDFSSGHWSSGHWSSGNNSSGNGSTGSWSSGNRSTGNWSISNYSTGHFSTIDYDGFSVFNKKCTLDEWNRVERPDFIYFDLTIFVYESDMTEKEKRDNPNYIVTGGFLKVLDYKEAWQLAWEKATDEDKELLYNLPNFDADVFLQISGIDVNRKPV